MEHRLITGEGSQWLPFARSCIIKLKRLGLPYANQSFEIDGASIKVRVEPGHEYIRIEGSYGELAMDSGVVDLINVGVNSPNRCAPGVLYQSAQTAAYKSAFTKPVNGGKTNPSNSTAGQFLGYLKASTAKVRGTVFDKAYSFYPQQKLISAPGVDPELWGADPEDPAVWEKKYAVNKCPASMFTGKCRLYAQAIYGRPLYKRNPLDADGNESGATVGGPDIPGVLDGNGRPYIRLTAYSKEGQPSPGTVDIWTSSGVHLHSETGRHFLLNPSGGKLYIYPLISTKTGESIRPLIRASSSLSAADKERCEAYILAYSLPDMTKVVVVDNVVPLSINTWSLGYGWHWNWSGTKATLTSFVIEGIDTYGQIGTPGYTILNKSSRYELSATITVTEDKTFTAAASMATIENNVYWYVQRGYACIAEPNWQSGGMVKSTDRFNRVFYDADAPIYSFYKRDTLQVVRVMIETNPVLPPDPPTSYSPPQFNNGRTFSYSGGTSSFDRPVFDILKVSFSCGGTTVKYSAGSGASVDVVQGGKTSLGAVTGGNFKDPPYDPIEVPLIYGPEGTIISTVVVPTSSTTRLGVAYGWSYQYTIELNNIDTIGSIMAVAPIFDAEAIFLYQRQESTTTWSRKITKYTGQGGYFGMNAGIMFQGWANAGTTTINSSTILSETSGQDDVANESATLVYSGGTTPARADLLKIGLADYGDDSCPLGANVFTGASTNVVVSVYINNSVGTDRTGEPLGMVGWV